MSRSDLPATSHLRNAALARTAASACLVAMPLVMWAANRSTPLMLSLAALCLIIAEAGEGTLRLRVREAFMALLRPLGLCILAFLVWALATVAWSHRPGPSLAMYGELVISLAAGVAVALTWPGRAPRWALRALAGSLALAGLLITLELKTGPGFRDALGVRSQLFIFNRPILTCVLLIVPVLQGLAFRAGASFGDRALAGLAALSVLAATLTGESGAAKLGLMLAAGTWIAALLLPRLVLAAVALAFLGMMAIAPVLGPVADRVLPASLYQQLSRAHARDRVDIWLSFGEAIAARPLIGAGFGTSAALRSHPVAEQVAPERRALLDVGHPHNAFVQVWVETGLVGVVFVTGAWLAFLARLAHLDARSLAPRLAIVAAALGIVSVGHGAWQGWWIAALGACAVWFMSLARDRAGGNAGLTS